MCGAHPREGRHMKLVDSPTIPQLARALPRPVPRRTMFRRLLALHGADRARAGAEWVPWLFRYEGGPWRVNVSRLRRAHPELFDVATNEELDRRLARAEVQIERVDTKVGVLLGRVRRLEAGR